MNEKLKYLTLFVIGMMLSLGMNAQSVKSISGTVTDDQGEAVISGTVKVKNGSTGTITDINGKYTLSVPSNATLVFSYIGYITQEFKVSELKSNVLNVVLQSDTKALDEVVVVGYGTMRKSDLTGSISTAKGKDMLKAQSFNALDGLKGKVAENGCYVTRAMAQTLLAQVYLQWAGAPLNGGADYYGKAAQMALKVINDSPHELIHPNGTTDDLNSAYNVIKTTKESAEIIYAKEYNYTNYSVGNSYACRSIGTDAFQWGVFHPGGDVLYNAYLPCDMLLNSYASNDIRGHEKQFFFKQYTDAEGKTYTLNNAGNWAWFDENALISGHDGDYNMPVFRFAEVLLIAAEGLARTNHEDNAVGGAKYYLNQVRKRAGLADETATGNDLIQSILTERLHELPLEFKIWDDIRRTRLYPEASTESGKLKWTALASAQIQNKPDGSTRAGAIPEYALLWPIPLDEIQANPALEGHQNPGWN